MHSDLLFFFKLPNLIIIVYINRLILIYKSCHLIEIVLYSKLYCLFYIFTALMFFLIL